jgi:type II secretory pathway predicted ATPase ExeA
MTGKDSMYQSYWRLDDTPFRTRPNRRFFYQSPTHEEALARLHFLVDERRRLGLLLGGHGTGKSLLLEFFAEEIRGLGRPVAKVNLAGVESREFLWLLAAEFELNPESSISRFALWQRVADRLSEYRYMERDTVVLLDDADTASQEVLTQVVRLTQLECLPDSRLTIVLAGQPERVGQLGSVLLELAELRIDLGPWDEADTTAFVAGSLAEAGRQDPVFDEPAVTRLHELGGGVPRRISQLADLALLAGAGRSLGQIDRDTVESVYHELGAIEVY